MPIVAVVGLGFGDEGKGTTVDYLCRSRPVDYVVRHNGGCQAYHNVVDPNGRHHGFAQWGSGTFAGAPTYLSRFFMVEPFAMLNEAEHLINECSIVDPWQMMYVDRRALLVTDIHRSLLRWRETARGRAAHGSTGYGIGEVMRYATEVGNPLTVGDVLSDAFEIKLAELYMWANEQRGMARYQGLDRSFSAGARQVKDSMAAVLSRTNLVDYAHPLDADSLVFEGAQGALLDEWYGFHPHTTWSTTTFENVHRLLVGSLNANTRVHRLGVIRSYYSRHGHGPFPTYDAELTAELDEPHNKTGRWMGDFRCGHFDRPLFEYALAVCGGVDGIALTHLDRAAQVQVCTRYENGAERIPLPEFDVQRRLDGAAVLRESETIGRWLAARKPLYSPGMTVAEALDGNPIEIMSYGPTYEDKVAVACSSSSLNSA